MRYVVQAAACLVFSEKLTNIGWLAASGSPFGAVGFGVTGENSPKRELSPTPGE